MQFTAYPKYKASGVEWLGEVPEHWEVVRFDKIFEENKRKNTGLKENNVLSLSYGNIKEKNIDSNKGLLPESFETYQIIEPNDIIFRFTDLQNDKRSLRSAISKFRGIITSAYISVKTEQNADFYHYLFRAYDLKKVFYAMGNGIRQSLKIDELNRMSVILPDISEQTAITTFLDKETAKIDRLIAKQCELIALLEEQKKAVVSHAVTKGLNPNAPMKDSGVEWLGEVPEHWNVGRLKHFAEINPKINKCILDDLEKVEFIPMANVDEKNGIIKNLDYRAFKEVRTGYTGFNSGDVVFAKITPCMENGNCSIIPKLKFGFGFGSTEFIVFRNKPMMKNKFLYYFMRHHNLRDIAKRFMTGTAGQQRISSDFLANYPIALPYLAEQEDIVAYIDQETTKIDNLIQKQQTLIEKLKEYRASVIAYAVTGKIDVRNLA